MSILGNAHEIDRLYKLHDKAEQEGFQARAAERRASEAAERSTSVCEGVMERINSLFDGMANMVPSTIDECLSLAVLLRSQTAHSVFHPDEHEEGRKRVDRMMDNLILGLHSLSTTDCLPHWFEEHILAAETGSSVKLDAQPMKVAAE